MTKDRIKLHLNLFSVLDFYFLIYVLIMLAPTKQHQGNPFLAATKDIISEAESSTIDPHPSVVLLFLLLPFLHKGLQVRVFTEPSQNHWYSINFWEVYHKFLFPPLSASIF